MNEILQHGAQGRPFPRLGKVAIPTGVLLLGVLGSAVGAKGHHMEENPWCRSKARAGCPAALFSGPSVEHVDKS